MYKSCLLTLSMGCLALLMVALAGCGGGNIEEHVTADATRQPVDCKATPVACR